VKLSISPPLKPENWPRLYRLWDAVTDTYWG
jgi:hypothetical protein